MTETKTRKPRATSPSASIQTPRAAEPTSDLGSTLRAEMAAREALGRGVSAAAPVPELRSAEGGGAEAHSVGAAAQPSTAPALPTPFAEPKPVDVEVVQAISNAHPAQVGNLAAALASESPTPAGQADSDASPPSDDPPLGEKARRLHKEAVRRSGGAATYDDWRAERRTQLAKMSREGYRRRQAAQTAEALANFAALSEVLSEESRALGYNVPAFRRLTARATAAGLRFEDLLSMIPKKS